LIKPAPTVGKISQMLFELVDDYLPLKLIWLNPEDTEYAIAQTQALAFTGSANTGRHLATLAGKYLRKSVMELGGSNAFIVLNDADIEQAAEDACYSRFRDAGQSCNAAKRIIVSDDIADRFIDALITKSQQLRMGAPWLAETTLGPLHREDLRHKIHTQVSNALQHGAKLSNWWIYARRYSRLVLSGNYSG